ncbi:MAG: helix-turn-helix transcriptional regulator [Chloroflexi bacterium]|nr:helix-turn-helix transcriptional regulator [Chloroflexota bacterium]
MYSSSTAAQIGESIRRWRAAKRMSVRTLASRADLSPSFISQVEHGYVSPSIGSLERIAAELEISLSDVFHVPVSTPPPTTNGGWQKADGWSGAQVQVLGTSDGAGCLDSVLVTVAPGGCSRTEREQYRSEKFACVFEGEITLTLPDGSRILRRGDTVTIPAQAPHSWENTSHNPAQILMVTARQ